MSTINNETLYFNNNLIFISKNSFKQNKQIANPLRKYVANLIKYDNITAIGGESYLYGLTNKNINAINHYAKTESIAIDAEFNNKFYRKKLSNHLINYNTFDRIKHSDLLIINLSKININLLNQINFRCYKEIIIINCDHESFWKRIELLTNFKLISRKKFITNNCFITVNVLINKKRIPIFIPLGCTCAISYQLNEVGLRHQAYPFDWAKISINQLNKVLEQNFESFTDINIKKYSENHLHLETNCGSFIITNKYGITFAHEVIHKYSLDDFKQILQKRVDRLLNNKNNHIKFIIFNTGKQLDLKKLSINLSKYFNDFDILEINPDEIYTDWTYNHMNWFELIY